MTASPAVPRVVTSTFLGEITEDPASELFLPIGLPGFETEQSFLPIEIPAHRPLVFLQSRKSPDICFVCLPASSILPTFEVCICEDDRLLLELDPGRELIPGEDILCLALLTPSGGTVKTNLDAPIVINLQNYRCAQVLQQAKFGSRRLNSDGQWDVLC